MSYDDWKTTEDLDPKDDPQCRYCGCEPCLCDLFDDPQAEIDRKADRRAEWRDKWADQDREDDDIDF